MTEVAEIATQTSYQQVRYDSSAGVPRSALHTALKSFDRVFEIIAPLLTTTPDLGQGYLHLSAWRMAAWRFHHRLRDGEIEEAHSHWRGAETARNLWCNWARKPDDKYYSVLT